MEEQQTVKISELESASSISSSDVLPIVQNGETKKVTADTLVNGTKNIITASITDNYTISATNTYELLPLNTSTKVGDKLTLSDGAIVIGANVSKILISAKASFQNNATGLKWLTVFRNSIETSIVANPRVITARDTIYSTSTLVEATENDKIYLGIYGTQNDIIRGTTSYTNITVEVVE